MSKLEVGAPHIERFVGTSAKALKVQVWTVLSPTMILKYVQLKFHFARSLSNLAVLPRVNLFTNRDLWAWPDRRLKAFRPPGDHAEGELVPG